MHRIALTVFALVLALPHAAAAQQPSSDTAPVDSLSHVRLIQTAVEPRRLQGKLLFADSRVITLDRGGAPLAIPLESIQNAHVSVGRNTPGEGAWRGTKRGFAIGLAASAALIGAGMVSDATSDSGDGWVNATTIGAVLSVPLTALTTASGAVLGGLAPGERWRPLRLPVRVRSGER